MEFGRPVRLQGLGSTGAALVDVGVAVTDAVGEVVGVEFASAGVSSMMTISTAPSAAAAAAVDETLELKVIIRNRKAENSQKYMMHC